MRRLHPRPEQMSSSVKLQKRRSRSAQGDNFAVADLLENIGWESL
jgi:hypothetical protein